MDNILDLEVTPFIHREMIDGIQQYNILHTVINHSISGFFGSIEDKKNNNLICVQLGQATRTTSTRGNKNESVMVEFKSTVPTQKIRPVIIGMCVVELNKLIKKRLIEEKIIPRTVSSDPFVTISSPSLDPEIAHNPITILACYNMY